MPLNPVSLPGLALFACVVRNGSMSRAAVELGLSRSSVSKQLAQFESRLGARLLQRTTRKLALTELGELVWREAQTMEQALANVDMLTDDYSRRVRGRLRVTCSTSLGRMHLLPLLPRFIERYPEVDLILQLEDRFVDLVGEQVDVAIRIGHLPDSSLVARKLGELRWQLVASPAYLARHGSPATPADLARHDCLIYRNTHRVMNNWEFEGPGGRHHVTVRGTVSINDACALIDAACRGLGILMVDHALLGDTLETGKLVRLLPNYATLPGLPVYTVYPARDWLPTKTSAFVEFLQEELAPQLAW